MRISPVGYAYDDLETVLEKAKEFTEITHNHPEGIKGGQATAAAIFLARDGKTRDEIKEFIEQLFQYDLSRHVDEIRTDYAFNELLTPKLFESDSLELHESGFLFTG